ncbi:MAG: DNA-processing protein DprA [Elusimicrobiota bacterium]
MRQLRRDCARYPALLQTIPDPPETLYVRGELDAGAPTLTMVGTRRPTAYGRRITRRLASELSRAGVVIVSGLARGIDTEAHRAALRAGGRTWAVLGSGLDRVYPAENKALADEIVAAGGALLGEIAPGGPPLAHNFPRRNRILSGLSWGTVVVEGGRRSGTAITARAAIEQGREVFAVPGPADSPMSEGPHHLLRQGACLVRESGDILAEIPAFSGLRPVRSGAVPPPNAVCYTLEGKKILQLLGSGEMSLEELLFRTSWELPRMAHALTNLESQGIISALPGQRYGRS